MTIRTVMTSAMGRVGLATVLAGGLGSAGCVKMAVGMTAPVVRIASGDFNRESDLIFAREASPGQVKTAEGFLAADPDNRILLDVVTRGYIEYTFGFLEDDLEALPEGNPARDALAKRATALYDRALAYALRYMATDDKNFQAAFGKDTAAVEAEIAKLDKDSVAPVFFTGLALASSINLNRNDMARVVDLPKAIALIKRAYKLDPTFYNGGPAMTLGIVYGSQGRAMGGDPVASKKYFEEAIATTGGKFLMCKVLMARFYAVTTQDRPLFDKLIKEVLDTPADIAPEFRLPNELAKQKARRYAAHADDLF